MPDNLFNYQRPESPESVEDTQGMRVTYRFRGPTTAMAGMRPIKGSIFDGRTVEQTFLVQIATSSWSNLTVITYKSVTLATTQVTDDQYPYFEIDEVQVEKSLKQHPAFTSLTPTDWKAIEWWEEETTSIKASYQYHERDLNGNATGTTGTLTGTTTTGAMAFARLRLLGVESFLDFAPVVRQTTKYLGSTPPACADAGQKNSAPSYAPSGYQWLKTADRVSKQGVRANAWIRQEEWTGARTVLLDKDSLYLST